MTAKHYRLDELRSFVGKEVAVSDWLTITQERIHAFAEVAPLLIIYINRLSDLLFVMARAANQSAGVSDVPWEKG